MNHSQKNPKILNFSQKMQTPCGDFEFLRKRKPAVPMYADGLCLRVFGAFLTA